MAEPDPKLAALDAKIAEAEAALAQQHKVSSAMTEQLIELAHREVAIATSPRPVRPPTPVSATGWTLEAFMEHTRVLRDLETRFSDERDRRYAEVNVEKEKALKIKETADLAALQLAREIQTYKDEKANELREQISSERGNYASKDDLDNAKREINATIKPLGEFVSAQQGRTHGTRDLRSDALAVIALLVSMAVLAVLIIHG